MNERELANPFAPITIHNLAITQSELKTYVPPKNGWPPSEDLSHTLSFPTTHPYCICKESEGHDKLCARVVVPLNLDIHHPSDNNRLLVQIALTGVGDFSIQKTIDGKDFLRSDLENYLKVNGVSILYAHLRSAVLETTMGIAGFRVILPPVLPREFVAMLDSQIAEDAEGEKEEDDPE